MFVTKITNVTQRPVGVAPLVPVKAKRIQWLAIY